MATENQTVASLILTEGTKRIYQMEDGSIETREGGSVSWRNNNPGNLKFEYARSADKTVHTSRTKDEALAAAQSKYTNVVALDQWGNAVFTTTEAGRAGQATLLIRNHGEKTIEEMLPSYAISDYSGSANINAYAKGIHAVGDAQGVDLRGKKIGEMNAAEISALQDGMRKVEGHEVGDVKKFAPSFRQIEEKSMQKMNEEGLSPRSRNLPATPQTGLNDPHHPGHALYAQSLAGLEKINAERGIPSDQRTCNAAGTLAVAACQAGFQRIDHVEPSVNGDRLLAVQGMPATVHSKVTHVDTVAALNTPVEDSSRAYLAALDSRASRPQVGAHSQTQQFPQPHPVMSV